MAPARGEAGIPGEERRNAGRRREARLDRAASLKAADRSAADHRASPLDHRRLKERRERVHGRGRPAQGGQVSGANATRAPAARREQKTALCDAPGRYSGPVYFGRDPNGEGPETRRITTAFVSGGEPRLPGRTYRQHGVTEARHGLKARRLLGGRATAANPACRDEPQGLNWVRLQQRRAATSLNK